MANIKSNHAEKNLVIMVILTLIIVALGYAIDTLHIDEKLFPNLKKVTPGAAILAQVKNIFSTSTSNALFGGLIQSPTSDNNTTAKNSSDSGTKSSASMSASKNTQTNTPKTTETATTSKYFGQVRIERGNAGNERVNSNKEYIILRSSSRNSEPIVITGWTLKNNKDQKYYDVVGGTIKGVSNYVTIPSGTHLLYGNKPSVLSPIFLRPGESAIVISGRIANVSPILIDASFRVNKCSGYIDSLDYYDFFPNLRNSCPDYRNIAATDMLSDDCYNFVKSVGQCQTPDAQLNRDNNRVINNRVIPNACRAYTEKHYNYNACVDEFSNDPDFYKNEWRIFLNTGIMWSRQNEIITLLDNQGKIVNTLSY